MARVLEVDDLSIAFGTVRVIDHVSFCLDAGSALAIVGRNGSGKAEIVDQPIGTLSGGLRLIMVHPVELLLPLSMAAAGLMGSVAVMRRMALASDALSHMALPGIAVAVLLHASPLLGGRMALLFGTLLVWALEYKTRLPTDAVIGVIFSAALAIGSMLTSGEELLDALFGAPGSPGRLDTILGLTHHHSGRHRHASREESSVPADDRGRDRHARSDVEPPHDGEARGQCTRPGTRGRIGAGRLFAAGEARATV